MNSNQSKNNYISSSQGSCSDLSYLNLQSQSGEMRYGPDTTTSSLPLDPPPLLGLFQSSNLGGPPTYTQDPSSFYQPAQQLFPAVDIRSRLSSHAAPNDMTAVTELPYPRPSALPHPVHHTPRSMPIRDQYSGILPLHSRMSNQSSRSPSLPSSMLRDRRQSSSPSPHTNVSTSSSNDCQENVLPLFPVQTYGNLVYPDPTGATAGQPINIDLVGTMSKNLFHTEGAWTCYRRNYMSCTCSYSLSPSYPGAAIQYTPSGETHAYTVYGFSVCISAMVADTEQNTVELKLHTPKRDKGPKYDPEKIALAPKPLAGQHAMGFYADGGMGGAGRGMYHDVFGSVGGNQNQTLPTEHTYERIQFRSATQNNGKRRAAQQFFHLVVELWADVGTQRHEPWIKVATRKSFKMIVRGRSPGHYSQGGKALQGNQQPPPSSGTNFYHGYGNVGDWPAPPLAGANPSMYSHPYDHRPPGFSNDHRHGDGSGDLGVYGEEHKMMDPVKPAYGGFGGSVYDAPNERVELFHPVDHHASSMMPPVDPYDKIKEDRDDDRLYNLDTRSMNRFMAGRSNVLDGQSHLASLQCSDRRSQYAS